MLQRKGSFIRLSVSTLKYFYIFLPVEHFITIKCIQYKHLNIYIRQSKGKQEISEVRGYGNVQFDTFQVSAQCPGVFTNNNVRTRYTNKTSDNDLPNLPSLLSVTNKRLHVCANILGNITQLLPHHPPIPPFSNQ